jgi:hypothetical protein
VFETPVHLVFSTPVVQAGRAYRTHIPGFAGQVVDIGYEMADGRATPPISGLLGHWCELDSNGEASIAVPPEHPAAEVRITKVRSQTKNGPWRKAEGVIQELLREG